MDIVTLGAALSGAKAYTDATIAPLLGGVHYRGSVNYFNNLPPNPAEGDAYTVKYSGTSGTNPDGTEYVWALDTDDNTYKWIGFSPDTYTKAEVDNLLSGKQDALVVGTNLDNTPTQNSTNPITSGGVYSTVGNIDSALSGLIMSLEPKTITANGTYNPTDDGVDGYNMVTVNIVNPVIEEKDVNFYDYDGTRVYSYTAQEFLALTEMPANPDRTSEGLTAQGWNWTLSAAKTHVTNSTKLDIGQIYITTDNCTKIYCEFDEENLDPYLGIGINGSCTIDWGDGSNYDTVTGTSSNIIYTQHHYSNIGKYIISIKVNTGTLYISGSLNEGSYILQYDNSNNNYRLSYSLRACIKKIHLGSNLSIRDNAFKSLYMLKYITLPKSLDYNYSNYMLARTGSLKNIVIPNGLTPKSNSFLDSSIEKIILPSGITEISQNAFNSINTLKNIIIPNTVTSIGQAAFSNCISLSKIVIPKNVTNLSNNIIFDSYGLRRIKFLGSTPPTATSLTFNVVTQSFEIYVPRGSLSAYTSAQYYPSSSTYTYVEY